MKSATLPLLLFGLFLSSSAAALETPRLFQKGQWDTTARASYFFTDANYFDSSSATTLASNGQLQLINGNFSTRYVFNRAWAFNAGLGVGNAESKSNGVTRSNGGLTDGTVGVETVFDMGGLELIPEFAYLFPFVSVNMDQDDAINSEGVNVTMLNLRMQVPFDGFTLFGMTGYHLRANRSNLVPWSVGVEFSARPMQFGARLFGYQSVSNDPNTGGNSELARDATLLRVNGGSYKFYSVNPSWVDSEAYGIVSLNRNWSIGGAGGLTLSGSNAASGWHVDGFITFRFNTEPVRRLIRATGDGSRISVDPYVDKFKEDTNDGIDQQLFQPPKPPPPPKPAPSAESMKAPTQRALPADQRAMDPAEAEKQQQIQNQLDNAEMSIQLKVDKKKKRK